MPSVQTLIRSTPHRHAALAVYRALLRQVEHAVPSAARPEDHQNANYAIRKFFTRNRHLQSARLVREAFLRGHEALRLLSGAALEAQPPSIASSAPPDSSKLATLNVMLSQLPPPPPRRQAPPKPPNPNSPSGHARTATEPNSILRRPYPKESFAGPRKVPRLFTPQSGGAYLRYKKPQPHRLSMSIKYRTNQKSKRSVWLAGIEAERRLGVWEDGWDAILSQVLEKGLEKRKGGKEGRWVRVWDEWRERLVEQQAEFFAYGAAMERKLRGIMDKERRLAEEEKKERRELRRAAGGEGSGSGRMVAYGQLEGCSEQAEDGRSSGGDPNELDLS